MDTEERERENAPTQELRCVATTAWGQFSPGRQGRARAACSRRHLSPPPARASCSPLLARARCSTSRLRRLLLALPRALCCCAVAPPAPAVIASSCSRPPATAPPARARCSRSRPRRRSVDRVSVNRCVAEAVGVSGVCACWSWAILGHWAATIWRRGIQLCSALEDRFLRVFGS